MGKIEEQSIKDTGHKYHLITFKSKYYTQELDIMRFIKDHHLRQIWRNHILGYSMVKKGDIKKFHHIFIPKEIHILELKRSLNTRGYLQKKEKSHLLILLTRNCLHR